MSRVLILQNDVLGFNLGLPNCINEGLYKIV